MVDLKAFDEFREVTLDEPQVADPQGWIGTENETAFEFEAFLNRQLKYLETYQNLGLLPHHQEFLAPAERLWLRNLQTFPTTIRSSPPSTSHQPNVHPILDARFRGQFLRMSRIRKSLPLSTSTPAQSKNRDKARELRRLRTSAELRQLQLFRDLQDFFHFLMSDSDDIHSPYKEQVIITAKCVEEVNAHLDQQPPEFLVDEPLSRTKRAYYRAAACIGLILGLTGFVLAMCTWSEILPGTPLFITAIVGFLISGVWLGVYGATKLSPPMLRWTPRGQVFFKKLELEQRLVKELRRLRAKMLTQRAPLRRRVLALLEERHGYWDQWEADLIDGDEHQQENSGHGDSSYRL
jgi:hypothetical protein